MQTREAAGAPFAALARDAERIGVHLDAATLACPRCQSQFRVPPGALEGGCLRRCVVCPSADVFVRKDFPQRLGVWLVVVGFAASCVAWYYYALYWTFGILFATALADVLLYLVCGEALQCYRCAAIYREVPAMEQHAPFSLDVHERHRQEAARRQESAVRSQGSGDRSQQSEARLTSGPSVV